MHEEGRFESVKFNSPASYLSNYSVASSNFSTGNESLMIDMYATPPATPNQQQFEYDRLNDQAFTSMQELSYHPSGYVPVVRQADIDAKAKYPLSNMEILAQQPPPVFMTQPRDSIIQHSMSHALTYPCLAEPSSAPIYPISNLDSPEADNASAVSDFSETNSLRSSIISRQDSSLLDKMTRMKTRCKRMDEPQIAYASAQFMVQNVQFLEKSEQISACEVAIKTLRKLANQMGHNDAAVALGHLYVRGIPGFQTGHKPDYSKALVCYSSSAKKDHTEGSFHLALCYEHGLGTQQNNSRAFQWYRKSAMNNHPGAMFRISSALLKGELGQQIDDRDGLKWMKLAAKYANEQYPQALYELALLHDEGLKSLIWPDHIYMIELLVRAAELQHASSQYMLGQAYEYGRYGVEKNPAKSIYFYSLASSNGHVEAMFELGGWYLVGSTDSKPDFILPQSDVEAFKWVRRAAERDLPRAMFAMGYFCEMGIGQIKDSSEETWEWYKRAAEAGDTKAIEKMKKHKRIFKTKSIKTKKSSKSLRKEKNLLEVIPKEKKEQKCIIM